METWPSNVNTNLLQDGFTQQAKDNRIRSSVEAGIDKLRRRYTTPIVNSSYQLILTYTEYEYLETFYNTTLQGGVSSFNFTDPATFITHEYRFLSPPSYSAFGGLSYIVTMQWERLD